MKLGGIYLEDTDIYNNDSVYILPIKKVKNVCFGIRLITNVHTNQEINNTLRKKLRLYSNNSFWQLQEELLIQYNQGYIGILEDDIFQDLEEKCEKAKKYQMYVKGEKL